MHRNDSCCLVPDFQQWVHMQDTLKEDSNELLWICGKTISKKKKKKKMTGHYLCQFSKPIGGAVASRLTTIVFTQHCQPTWYRYNVSLYLCWKTGKDQHVQSGMAGTYLSPQSHTCCIPAACESSSRSPLGQSHACGERRRCQVLNSMVRLTYR